MPRLGTDRRRGKLGPTCRLHILLLLVLAVGGCAETDRTPADGGTPPELDPCGGADHPCTLAEVTPEAEERTDELAERLLQHLQSSEDLDEAAGWLSEQDGVVSVATGPEAVRFRVRGGRGHWIFMQTAGTVATLASPTLPLPPRTSAGAGISEPHEAVGSPAGTHPAGTLPQSAAEGQIKKALLLSPFRWQWEVEGGDDGIDDVAKALRARDYLDVTVWTERLDPANPKQTIGEIGLPAFTTWHEYDYVHLLTHGGRVCNQLGHCMTVVMAPWTQELVSRARAGAETAGNDDLATLLDRVGVETAKVRVAAGKDRIPYVGPGQESREDIPLTERHKPEDQQQPYTLTGEFLLLTSQFFRDTYQNGLDSAVLVISACSSGYTNDLLDALQGENTAVIGWRDRMSLRAAAAAGALIAKTLVEVDEKVEDDSGLTVEQAMERIRDRLDDLARDPPDFRSCANPSDPEVQARCDMASKAQVLTVINDGPGDPVTGASLKVVGDGTVRAREIVYLVDEAGDELTEGSLLEVTSAAGDARGDSVDLRIRVDGLALEDDPRSVDLKVAFEGREIDVEKKLEEEVAEGVWELDYRLPLGRDSRPGERVTMEVVGELADGGDSRWTYEDLRLGGASWTLTISSGPAAGRYRGGDARASIQNGRLMSIVLHSTNSPMCPVVTIFPRRPTTGPGTVEAEAEAAFVRCSGSFGNILEGTHYGIFNSGEEGEMVDPNHEHGLRERPRLISLPPPARLEIHELSEEWVAGSLRGEFFESVNADQPKGRSSRVRASVEFRAQPRVVGAGGG